MPLYVAHHLTLNELERRCNEETDPLTRDRLQAVRLAAQSKSRKEVAAALGRTERWVTQTLRRYNREGPEALRDRRHQNPGPPLKLTPEEQSELLEALQGPAPGGGAWTGRKVQIWVQERLGKKISLAPAYAYLKRLRIHLPSLIDRHNITTQWEKGQGLAGRA
jgi:transposase